MILKMGRSGRIFKGLVRIGYVEKRVRNGEVIYWMLKNVVKPDKAELNHDLKTFFGLVSSSRVIK